MSIMDCIEVNKKIIPEYQNSKSTDHWDLPRGKKLKNLVLLKDNVIYNGILFKRGMQGFTLENRLEDSLLVYFPIKKSRGLVLELYSHCFNLLQGVSKPRNYDTMEDEFKNTVFFKHESTLSENSIQQYIDSIKLETGADNVYIKIFVCPDGRHGLMFSTIPIPKDVTLVDFVNNLIDNNIIMCPSYSLGFYSKYLNVKNFLYSEYYYEDLKFID